MECQDQSAPSGVMKPQTAATEARVAASTGAQPMPQLPSSAVVIPCRTRPSSSSACRDRGSVKQRSEWEWRSMNPGVMRRPRASIVVAAGASIRGATAAIESPSMPISAGVRGPPAPSTTSALVMIRSSPHLPGAVWRVGRDRARRPYERGIIIEEESGERRTTPESKRAVARPVHLEVALALPAVGAPFEGLLVVPVAAIHDVVPDTVLPAVEVGVGRPVAALHHLGTGGRVGRARAGARVARIDGAQLSLAAGRFAGAHRFRILAYRRGARQRAPIGQYLRDAAFTAPTKARTAGVWGTPPARNTAISPTLYPAMTLSTSPPNRSKRYRT